jgi:hypothetical protein
VRLQVYPFSRCETWVLSANEGKARLSITGQSWCGLSLQQSGSSAALTNIWGPWARQGSNYCQSVKHNRNQERGQTGDSSRSLVGGCRSDILGCHESLHRRRLGSVTATPLNRRIFCGIRVIDRTYFASKPIYPRNVKYLRDYTIMIRNTCCDYPR